MSFRCIYCRSQTDGAFAEAHIFPDAIGGTASSVTTVCSGCNINVNQGIEQRALPAFAVFLSLWGIQSRRGKIPRVPAATAIEGHDVSTALDEHGRPTGAIVKKITHADGRLEYLIFGTPEAVEVKRSEMSKKNPGLRWEEPHDTSLLATVELPKPADRTIRRLAAKVALEYFASIRGSEAVVGADFQPVCDFILEDRDTTPCVAVVSNEKWLFGPMNYPVPSHAAHVLGHPADRVLGSFVTFFGLYSYAVVLSRDYPVVGAIDELLFEYPDARESHRPALRLSGHPRIPWLEIMTAYDADPGSRSAVAERVAQRKLAAALVEQRPKDESERQRD